jgi:hypothetical protein
VIFAGGIPLRVNGTIAGPVGASAGTVEQDIAVAEAAAAALPSSCENQVDRLLERQRNKLESRNRTDGGGDKA